MRNMRTGTQPSVQLVTNRRRVFSPILYRFFLLRVFEANLRASSLCPILLPISIGCRINHSLLYYASPHFSSLRPSFPCSLTRQTEPRRKTSCKSALRPVSCSLTASLIPTVDKSTLNKYGVECRGHPRSVPLSRGSGKRPNLGIGIPSPPPFPLLGPPLPIEL